MMSHSTSTGKHALPGHGDDTDPITKRLRGGGNTDDEELYDEDDFHNNDDDDDDDEGEGDDYMDEPDEDEISVSQSQSNTNTPSTTRTRTRTDTADTAINFTDLSSTQLKRWTRKPIPPSLSDTSNHDIHLQWLDMDIVPGQPLAHNPNPSKRYVIGSTSGEVPIIRVYGVTDEGNSIVAFIHGYTSYAYFALPEGYELKYETETQKNVILGNIRDVLNARMRNAKSYNRRIEADIIQGVQYLEDHKSIMGYSTSHTRFLKVFVSLPDYISALKRVMEEGVSLPGISAVEKKQQNVWEDGHSAGTNYQPFECNVPFVLRFMIDQTICGAGWLTLPKGTYSLKKDKITNCQVCVCFEF